MTHGFTAERMTYLLVKGLDTVKNTDQRRSLTAALGALGWPMVVGLGLCSVFYVLLLKGPLANPTLIRYFAAHPVSFTATAMFFVGMTAMSMKLLNVMGQSAVMSKIQLGSRGESGQTAESATALIADLDRLTTFEQSTYLATRLRDALQFITRTENAGGLDDELKYLADIDAARQQDSFALPRIIIWATPMLGFLGTVIGITQALGDLDPSELATSADTAMSKLLAGLYVAFDTTALALCLSIVMMFVQFLIDRFETQLLSIVDARVNDELVGRFQQVGNGNDPHLTSIQRMCEAVVGATEQLVNQQSTIWQSTIDAAHQQWNHIVGSSTTQMQTAIGSALDQSLEKHAHMVAATQKVAMDENVAQWKEWQRELGAASRALGENQIRMAEQSTMMKDVMQATADVVKLETALNHNLQTLAGSQNFEETVMSLSAAIHLLNSRLGTNPSDTKAVDLKRGKRRDKAA